jgi:hypothetical protein
METYFQFPISALSLNLDRHWSSTLDFACLDYGRKITSKDQDRDFKAEADQYLADHPALTGSVDNLDNLLIIIGYRDLNVCANGGTIAARVKAAREVERHCSTCAYPLVRLRNDLWWKTFTPHTQEHHLSVREFRVLCAIYAAIGAKPYAKASLDLLRRYASGYPQRADFESALADPSRASSILTPKQIRSTRDVLETLGFFARFTFNRGECFYSNKMDQAKLHEVVGRKKLRRLETLHQKRSLDQAASQKIINACRSLRM